MMKRKRFYYFLPKHRSKKTPFHIEESSALSDVAFLLLIFFIVTSSFVIPQGIYLVLPNPKGNTIKLQKKNILYLSPLEENYTLNNKTYTETELDVYFKDIKKQYKKEKDLPLVMLTIKKEILYQRLIDTLTLLKKYKWKKISFKDKPV